MLPGLKERACLNKLIERMDVEVPAAMAEAAEANLLQELFQQLQASGMSFDAYLQQMGLKAENFRTTSSCRPLTTSSRTWLWTLGPVISTCRSPMPTSPWNS